MRRSAIANVLLVGWVAIGCLFPGTVFAQWFVTEPVDPYYPVPQYKSSDVSGSSLDGYLENRLNIPTRAINPMHEVPLSESSILPDISSGAPFALALGLAMRKVTWL